MHCDLRGIAIGGTARRRGRQRQREGRRSDGKQGLCILATAGTPKATEAQQQHRAHEVSPDEHRIDAHSSCHHVNTMLIHRRPAVEPGDIRQPTRHGPTDELHKRTFN